MTSSGEPMWFESYAGMSCSALCTIVRGEGGAVVASKTLREPGFHLAEAAVPCAATAASLAAMASASPR